MVRYRSETPFGDGVRDILSVLVHETYEMGNSDIVRYLVENYLFGPLKDDAITLCKELEENGFVDDYGESDWQDFFLCAIHEINLIKNCNLRFCLWLADKDVVKDYYCKNCDEYDLCGYETSPIILSDLGHDGALYAYETVPIPISTKICSRSV